MIKKNSSVRFGYCCSCSCRTKVKKNLSSSRDSRFFDYICDGDWSSQTSTRRAPSRQSRREMKQSSTWRTIAIFFSSIRSTDEVVIARTNKSAQRRIIFCTCARTIFSLSFLSLSLTKTTAQRVRVFAQQKYCRSRLRLGEWIRRVRKRIAEYR